MALKRGLLIAALLAMAALAQVGPSTAFDALSLSRAATANVVADNSAYNALTITVCSVSTLTSNMQWCTFGTVQNKATIDQTFYLTEQLDESKRVSEWRFGGGTAVTSGRASTASTVAVAGSATLEARVTPCFLCPDRDYTTTWTIEGEKPNRLNSIASTVQVTIRYTS